MSLRSGDGKVGSAKSIFPEGKIFQSFSVHDFGEIHIHGYSL